MQFGWPVLYQQLLGVWNTDFNSFSMPFNLHIKTSFQVTPFSPLPRHPSRGSLLLFRRSKMAGATATFSKDMCRGKRALGCQEFCVIKIRLSSPLRFRLILGHNSVIRGPKWPLFRPCIARVFSGYRILASFALPRSRHGPRNPQTQHFSNPRRPSPVPRACAWAPSFYSR